MCCLCSQSTIEQCSQHLLIVIYACTSAFEIDFRSFEFRLAFDSSADGDVWIHLHWHERDFNKRCRNHCGQRMNSIWILLDSAGTMIHMVLGPLILILNILFVDNFPTGQFSALKIPVWIVCKWTVSIYANDFDSLNCCRMRMLLVQLRLFSWNWQVFTWNNVETLFISGAKMRSKSKSHGKNRLNVNGFVQMFQGLFH